MFNMKKFVKNSFALINLQVFSYLIPLIIIPYLIRVLGVNQFGIYAFAQAVCGYLYLVGSYGFHIKGVQRIARAKDCGKDLCDIYSEITTARLFLIFVCFILLVFYCSQIPENEAATVLIIAVSGVSDIFCAHWFFLGLGNVKVHARIIIMSKVLYLFGILLFVHEESDIIIAAAVYTTSSLVSAIFTVFYLRTRLNLKYRICSLASMIHSLRDGWSIFVASLSTSTFRILPLVVLGTIFKGEAVVGHFAIADSISKAATRIIQPISQAALPFSSQKFSKGGGIHLEYFKFLCKVYLAVGAILSILLYFLAPQFIHFFSGKYIAESEWFLMLLSPIPLVVAITNLFGIQIMTSTGNDREYGYILMVCGVAGITICTLLYCQKNIFLAPLATLLPEFISAILTVVFFKYKIRAILFKSI